MFVSCECCVLLSGKASATSRSLVQRSPTDCSVSLSVIKRKLQTSTLKRETVIGRRVRLKKHYTVQHEWSNEILIGMIWKIAAVVYIDVLSKYLHIQKSKSRNHFN
jgi:hypothetical protein